MAGYCHDNPAVQDVLFSLIPSYPKFIDLSLGRFKNVLATIGNPHLNLPPVLHVAGTNGKGSTLAFLQAMFEAQGYRVHKSISPHLIRYNERIILQGREIDDAYLIELIKEVCEKNAGAPASVFEILMGVTFLAFSRVDADIVLLETGLGGRYDATNIVPQPLVSLISRISLDHMATLGTDVESIAYEKAGIIKPEIPVVIGYQEDKQKIDHVFQQEATAKKAPISFAEQDWHICLEQDHVCFKGFGRDLKLPKPNLLGAHQIENAGLALATIFQLDDFEFSNAALEQAMVSVKWPGRFQQIPVGDLLPDLGEDWQIWLDGAHNVSGAEMIAQQIDAWQSDEEKPLDLIVALRREKNIINFLSPILKKCRSVHLIDLPERAPSYPVSDFVDLLNKEVGRNNVYYTPDLKQALKKLSVEFSEPARILITGSLYLVGHVLKIMQDPSE